LYYFRVVEAAESGPVGVEREGEEREGEEREGARRGGGEWCSLGE